MPKSCKKILKVLFILLLVFVTVVSINIYAEETNTTTDGNQTTENKTTCTKEAANNKYKTKFEVPKGKDYFTLSISAGQFLVRVIRTDMDGNGYSGEDYILNADPNAGEINNSININYDTKTQHGIIVIFAYIGPDDGVCSPNSEEVQNIVKSTMKSTKFTPTPNSYITTYSYDVSGTAEPPVLTNKHYNGLCKKFREGVWDDKFGTGEYKISKKDFQQYNPAVTNAASEYAGYIPYCYSETYNYNYEEDYVIRMMKNAIRSYKAQHSSNGEKKEIPVPPNAEKNYNLSNSNESEPTFSSNQKESLKCSPTKFGYKLADGTLYDYVNMNTYYAHNEWKKTETLPNSGKTMSCNKACGETITVYYGPPVATRGGLCFEYKVKVESKVTCSAEFTGSTPSRGEYKECDPTPVCAPSKNDYTANQAGPSEDYDKCIRKCDNGKYTQKCANKCYKEVYGSGKNKKLTSTLYNNARVLKINNPACPSSVDEISGYYTRVGGSITWVGTGGYWSKYARWYFYPSNISRTCRDDEASGGTGDPRCIGQWGTNCMYTADANGFKDTTTFHCIDVCEYTGCYGANDYLNPGEAEEAYEEDLRAFEAFKSSCTAQASCSTKTAEFTIKVNNRTADKPTQDNWINYTAAEISQGGILTDASGVVIDRKYCYNNNEEPYKYLTEWSFPGTWVNNKTGEIKYTPVTGKQWHQKKSKFCTNLNSADVNTKWWQYGMKKGVGVETPSQEVLNGIEYNILASARKFGHYAWNIDVSCFYALYDNPFPDSPVCDCTDAECLATKNDPTCTNLPDPDDPTKKNTISYRIRTVDNKDLFPDTDENPTTETATTGRTPGFNWTADAENLKNTDYIISPVYLVQRIQSRADEIYDEQYENSYLDYRFVLDREALSRIRQYSKNESGSKYTTFSGTFTVKNGVSVYNSPLFRSVGSSSYRLDSKYVKTRGVLGCNNQANSDRCESYSELGTIGG